MLYCDGCVTQKLILRSPEKYFLIYSTNQPQQHNTAKRLKESLRKVDSLWLWEESIGHNP